MLDRTEPASCRTSSTVIATQVPVKNWIELIGDPTLADAILDRLVHNAHKINLKGESMRKIRSSLTKTKNLGGRKSQRRFAPIKWTV